MQMCVWDELHLRLSERPSLRKHILWSLICAKWLCFLVLIVVRVKIVAESLHKKIYTIQKTDIHKYISINVSIQILLIFS